MKQRTNELVSLAFREKHQGIRIWVLTQQTTSNAKPFRENVAALVLFNTSSAKDMKIIFESYSCELTREEKSLMDGSKSMEYSHLVFTLCHTYSINLKISPSAI